MKRIWELIGSVSVRTKIMGIVLGLVALLGLGMTFWVRYTLENALRNQVELRGVSVTRDLAARATDLVLTNNTFALHNLVRDTAQNNEDLLYAFILDERRQLIVHSFDSGFPKGLRQANSVAGDAHHNLALLNTEEGLVWDFAVPIFDGKAGTARVGISERHLQAAVAATTQQLLTATALASILGIVSGYILTWVLTRPVLNLVKVTRAVGQGDLGQRAPVWARDEIGQLTVAFNGMVSDLGRERDRSQEYNQKLLRRNRELAALNAVATAMSGSLALNEVLERALRAVLEAMGFSAGWVFLFDESGLRQPPVCSVGISASVLAAEGLEVAPCHCHQATEQHKTLVIQLTGCCPALGAPLARGGQIGCHATVPLMAQDRVLGVLNIAGRGPGDFTEDDLELLGAVGHELGVAVENVRLWEELRRKEELRGELLAKVITAQEEERRRISRELHDETGQSLTSLMVGLKVASESDAPQSHLIELRAIAAQTLTGVRDLARELRPSLLDDLGLVAALERYLAGYGAKYNLDTDFQATGFGDGRRLTPETEVTLYRIIQEALTNVRKHARAKCVRVRFEANDQQVLVAVEDDGCGFDVAQPRREHFGLQTMRERAESVGGTFEVNSERGRGTRIRVRLPYPATNGDGV